MPQSTPAQRAAVVRDQLRARPEIQREVLTKLAPPYLKLATDNDTRGFSDWQQFSQWPQSSQW